MEAIKSGIDPVLIVNEVNEMKTQRGELERQLAGGQKCVLLCRTDMQGWPITSSYAEHHQQVAQKSAF